MRVKSMFEVRDIYKYSPLAKTFAPLVKLYALWLSPSKTSGIIRYLKRVDALHSLTAGTSHPIRRNPHDPFDLDAHTLQPLILYVTGW